MESRFEVHFLDSSLRWNDKATIATTITKEEQTMRIIIVLLMVIHIAASQTVYELPFASQGHEVALVVANTSTVRMEGVKVEVSEAPHGIRFTEGMMRVGELMPKGEQEVVFRFSVEKTAKVGTEQTIAFRVTDTTGESWRKEVVVRVSLPERFEVYQNYPNPFNLVTTLSYQLPNSEQQYNVSVKLYDIIGREVLALNRVQSAGYYQEQLDCSKLPSGVYIIKIHAQSVIRGNSYTSTKKMTLMK